MLCGYLTFNMKSLAVIIRLVGFVSRKDSSENVVDWGRHVSRVGYCMFVFSVQLNLILDVLYFVELEYPQLLGTDLDRPLQDAVNMFVAVRFRVLGIV